MKKLPSVEQETVIIWDNLERKWHISTDVPKHIRKYLPLLKDPRVEKQDGEVIYCEGWLDGSVSVSKKRTMTEEQKQQAAERLKLARASKSK